MSTSGSCKDTASKSNDDDVCDVKIKLQNIRIGVAVSICANCGKEGANNICNKCKQVKYCNAVCKKVHKKKHKKDCEEHVRLATKLHDEKLFKQPPSEFGDCPICFLRLPYLPSGRTYKTCCGKMMCNGCAHAPVYDNQGNEVAERSCPFCRTLHPHTKEESIERTKKRVEAEDPIAIRNLGCYYREGVRGYPQDMNKALEMFHRAAELGFAKAYSIIAYAYEHGEGVEADKKKAIHYYELAALRGDIFSRHNLGCMEIVVESNFDRALKHFMIAVRGGNGESLKQIRILYTNGHATIDDDTKALQLYQEYLGEIKSQQRDKAAETHETYRYH